MRPISTTTCARPPLAERFRIAAVLGVALMAAPLPLAAQAVPGPGVAEIVAGLICAATDTDRRDAPGTLSGWIHVPTGPVQMVARGHVAPAVLGVGFGVSYRLAPGVSGPVTYTVQHPPIPPTGATTQSWDGFLEPGVGDTVYFQFDVPEELQVGAWQFSATLGGQTLFTADFEVVAPDSVPELLGLCRAPGLLSWAPVVSPTAPAGSG